MVVNQNWIGRKTSIEKLFSAGNGRQPRVGKIAMTRRNTRSNDWGFPRWREYGADREAVKVRLCDRHGCTNRGDRPAPKSPNSPERWYFCEEHAGEYNRNWDYFEGLNAEEAAEREANERRDYSGYKETQHYGWGGPGDGSRSRDEMRSLDVLGLETDAEFDAVRTAWRKLAKENHPDVKPDDKDAATRFQSIQAAYDVLKAAEERRMAL
jgi:DnaJ domain